MTVDTNRQQLVRGVLIYSQWRAGCIGIEQAKDEDNLNVGVAYTHWHRHDEDPKIVEGELEMLFDCYRKFRGFEGCQMGFEYRDYRK